MDKAEPQERLLVLMGRNKLGEDREFVVGSITRATYGLIFYKRIVPARDILRIRGVWGIDVRVLDVLRADGITEIHCYDDEKRELYTATLQQFDELGETLKLKTTMVYLPLEHWTKTKKRYRTSGLTTRQVLP